MRDMVVTDRRALVERVHRVDERTSLLAEVIVFGLAAVAFVVYPAPIAAFLSVVLGSASSGQFATTILTYGFLAVWFVFFMTVLVRRRL